jgi:hypothetical protein
MLVVVYDPTHDDRRNDFLHNWRGLVQTLKFPPLLVGTSIS